MVSVNEIAGYDNYMDKLKKEAQTEIDFIIAIAKSDTNIAFEHASIQEMLKRINDTLKSAFRIKKQILNAKPKGADKDFTDLI